MSLMMGIVPGEVKVRLVLGPERALLGGVPNWGPYIPPTAPSTSVKDQNHSPNAWEAKLHLGEAGVSLCR